MKSLPGSPFEVVEPKLLFQLLMGLLAIQRALMVAAKVRRSVAQADWRDSISFSPELRCSPISQASSPGSVAGRLSYFALAPDAAWPWRLSRAQGLRVCA